jgi:hypothetical protein
VARKVKSSGPHFSLAAPHSTRRVSILCKRPSIACRRPLLHDFLSCARDSSLFPRLCVRSPFALLPHRRRHPLHFRDHARHCCRRWSGARCWWLPTDSAPSEMQQRCSLDAPAKACDQPTLRTLSYVAALDALLTRQKCCGVVMHNYPAAWSAPALRPLRAQPRCTSGLCGHAEPCPLAVLQCLCVPVMRQPPLER